MTESASSPNLLCMEDTNPSPSRDTSLDPADEEDSIAVFIGIEWDFVPRFEYHSELVSSSVYASARESSISWIIKVREYYGFQPLTAYLAVNYLDRFLSVKKLPTEKEWPMQLLSVACLSLAAKMEEIVVPPILEYQVEAPKYFFRATQIRRMELLVLNSLKWRLRSITPFNFIEFFARKTDPAAESLGFLKLRASQIVLSSIKEKAFLLYPPSSVAVSAVLCAASEIPRLPLLAVEEAGSWCDGLGKENIARCYDLMGESRASRKRKIDD